MDNEIQLVSDDGGVALIGESTAVERFLTSTGLPSKDLGIERLAPVLGAAAGVAQAGSELAANSGRWVKLTKESLAKMNEIGVMKGSAPGQLRGVIQAHDGQIKGIVEFVKGPGALLANPAVLGGVAGIMAQAAMQQQMDEIADYLAVIDEKVDDVLRAQKDAAVAEMIGADFVIEEAMSIREQVGRVSEVTWSKVQSTSMVIGRTQAYALRQLDALAEKLERKSDVDELAKAAKEAESVVQEWLAVLAHCFRLEDATAVLELDRVLDTSPEDLEQHRRGLQIARQHRLESISRSTQRLIDRMGAAAGRANAKVLFNPINSPAVVRASNDVTTRVVDFRGLLGIERDDRSVEARQWTHAAGDLRDKLLEVGADGVGAGRRFGAGSLNRARSMTNKLASGLADRTSARDRADEGS